MSKHKSGDPWADIFSVLAVVTQFALAFYFLCSPVACWMDGSILLQSTGRHLLDVMSMQSAE